MKKNIKKNVLYQNQHYPVYLNSSSMNTSVLKDNFDLWTCGHICMHVAQCTLHIGSLHQIWILDVRVWQPHCVFPLEILVFCICCPFVTSRRYQMKVSKGSHPRGQTDYERYTWKGATYSLPHTKHSLPNME